MYFRLPHEDRRPPKGIFNHKHFDDDTLEYDIALVKIEKVEFTSHIQPISLPKALVCDEKDRKRKKGGKRKRKKKRRRKRQRKRGKGKRKQRRKKKKTKKKKGKGKWAKEEALIDDMTQVIKELKKKMMEDIEEVEEIAEEDGSGSGFGSGDGHSCKNVPTVPTCQGYLFVIFPSFW